MEIDAILCDHAQAADGKLFISGGGIDRSFAGPDLPHMISLGLGAVVRVPYTATNQVHKFTVTIVDEDGQPVGPYSPDGIEQQPVQVEIPFNLGRPPGMMPGMSQPWSVALNFQLPLGRLGQYHFVVGIDGSDEKRLPLLLTLAPQAPNMTFPSGPAAPGRIG
jgi:hypothetical protein